MARIAITGATGFIGDYIIRRLSDEGHQLRCWYRDANRILPDYQESCEWIEGELGDEPAGQSLLADCDAVVHAALYKPGASFRGGEGNPLEFSRKNVLGSLQLIELARELGVRRFVYISTCAVHERILDDRPLDEAHPLWPLTHYGAHKAAVEKFVHSYGFGQGFSICALRPTGVYGLMRDPRHSKWFGLVQQVVQGEPVICRGGGKEVHAADVATAVSLLLQAPGIEGECYNCYDRYVSEYDVAREAQRLSGSSSEIRGEPKSPKHEIETGKLRSLGMQFGGQQRFTATIQQLIDAAKT